MFEERRERKQDERAEEMQREQAAAAVDASETDDASFEPNERLQDQEEPDAGHPHQPLMRD